MAKFLITGGAGFLGINLARYLLGRNHQVVSLDVADFDYPERDRVKIVKGDIRDPAKVAQAMDGADIVVHTAAALPLYKKEEIFSVDIDGTRTVLEEACKRNVDRFIHISSTAVYGIPDHHPLFENDKLQGVGPYGIAKIEAEGLCASYRQKGMCVPIIRPKSFIGPERLGVFAMFYDWAKDGRNFPLIGNGRNRYQLLDVEDLCAAIYLCATLDRTIANDVFNVGAKDYTTMKEDFQAVLDRAGRGKRMIAFPGLAHDLDAALSRNAPPLAAVQVGLRDSLHRLVRLHRKGTADPGLQPPVLQQGRPGPQLRLVSGQPALLPEHLGDLAPRALEAGNPEGLQEALLERQFLPRSWAGGQLSRLSLPVLRRLAP